MEEKEIAVALSYQPTEKAPKVIASGKGHVAEKIKKKAKEEQIPIQKNASLAKTLSQVEIGQYIPKDVYGVVAEILVFVGDLEAMKGKVKREK